MCFISVCSPVPWRRTSRVLSILCSSEGQARSPDFCLCTLELKAFETLMPRRGKFTEIKKKKVKKKKPLPLVLSRYADSLLGT